MADYRQFLEQKTQWTSDCGFDASDDVPDWLFGFQRELVKWACRRGRAAIFADCGLGKTPMQLVWADLVAQWTNSRVLIVAPLSASAQTVREAEKFGIEAHRSKDGSVRSSAGVTVTNYEKLHLFDPSEFSGMVCDESSILKNFDGVTKAAVTEFMRRLPFRLLCTATAAPNDYTELGTSSEALGYLGHMDMLARFFKNDENSLAPLSHASKWRFKPHAERPFWRWLCSWARVMRKPADMGFDNEGFALPALVERVTTVQASRPMPGQLFVTPAADLREQRAERRHTIRERCEAVAACVDAREPFVAWCHLNDEADLLERLLPHSKQVSGDQDEDEKEELFDAFQRGQLLHLITKPKIGAFGLNWQHCAHMSVFPSHSYEQYYQAVRRCWRFGQTRDVVVEVITTAGESDVLANLQSKAAAADRMFAVMVEEMNNELGVATDAYLASSVALPSWMGGVS